MNSPSNFVARPAFFAILMLGMIAIGFFSTHPAVAAPLDADNIGATEKANEQLVRDFLMSFDTLYVDELTPYLADDVTFTGGMEDTEGKDHFARHWVWTFRNVMKQETEILRVRAIGNFVLSESITVIYGENFTSGKKKHSFRIGNSFHIKDGKITTIDQWGTMIY